MNELATGVLQALAMIGGVALILVVCVFLAAFVSESINPTPEVSPEEAAKNEVASFQSRQELDRQFEDLDRDMGKESVDTTDVSFPVFGITWVIFTLFYGVQSVTAHAAAPGEGIPLALVLLPLWAPIVAGLIVGTIAGSAYKRWYLRQPESKRRELRRRRREKAERKHRGRLRAIRDSARPRRRGKVY